MFEILKLAFKELYSNKGRTILTSLGIAIGVMAISLILSSGNIARQYIETYLQKSIGKPTAITVNADFNSRTATTKLDYKDYQFFRSIQDKYPITVSTLVSSFPAPVTNLFEETVNQNVRGVNVDYPQIAPNKNVLNLSNGRFFSQSEFNSAENVAVISTQFAKDIKGKESLLGERVKFGTTSFLIIGEFAGESSLTANEKEVIIPITSLWKLRNANNQDVIQILYTVESEDQIDFVSKNVLEEINNYRELNFSGDYAKRLSTASSKSAIETIGSVLVAFQFFLGLVAVISLVVGGIGVLNVMLMSVAQRIKEIGIRKAFGAKNRDILILFLSESIVLTALSGLFGALLAQYLVFVGVMAVNSINPDLGLVSEYSWFSIYLAFLVSCVVGALFGLYPAWKAGKMSVVEALRYD